MRVVNRFRFVALTLVPLSLLLALPSGTLAAPPEEKFNVITIDGDEFVDEFLTAACGFEVLHRVDGTIMESGFVDEAGEFVVTKARFRLKESLVGPTGTTLTYPNVGIDRFVDNPDATVTVTSIGILALRVVVPGEGLVIANIGRVITTLTFDPVTGEVIAADPVFEAGQRPEEFDEEEALAAICAYLAG